MAARVQPEKERQCNSFLTSVDPSGTLAAAIPRRARLARLRWLTELAALSLSL
jgi:hypothetical protein